MIITHTQSATGQRRVYLGGKSSMEIYIEPGSDGTSWTLKADPAVTGNPLSLDNQRDTAVHTLLALAQQLHVAPHQLRAVPFEMIAALHDADPYASRRVASSKRKAIENGFMATAPEIRRPAADYTSDRPHGDRASPHP